MSPSLRPVVASLRQGLRPRPPSERAARADETPVERWSRRVTVAMVALPDRIVTSFLLTAVAVGLAVIFHVFMPAVVLPLALLAILAGWRWTPSSYLELGQLEAWWREGPSRQLARTDGPATDAAMAAIPGRISGAAARPRSSARAAAGSAVALTIIGLWLVVNGEYTSANVVLERDPGIYTLRAMWLIDHRTPVMDVSATAQSVTGITGVQVGSLAFPVVRGTIYPQSLSLLPGLLAVLGWFAQLPGVLAGNLLIGGIGLLAVYAFGRRLLGPLWALIPMAALAACLPMVAFSRSSYSEPVALVATFGGMTLLWIAWRTGKLAHFLMAGLLIGVSSLARIDGAVTLIGILAGFAVVTIGTRDPSLRRRVCLAATAWAAGAGSLEGLSLLDAKINSHVYLDSEWHGLQPLLVATTLAYLIAVGVA